MGSKGYHFGVDIGGTKTAVGIFDRQFRPLHTATIPTRAEEGCRVLAEHMEIVAHHLNRAA